jgi:hypothetical protein
MANWRQTRFRVLVQQKFEPMKAVWQGPHSLDISVAAIVGDWRCLTAEDRKAAIVAVLTQGEAHEIAA